MGWCVASVVVKTGVALLGNERAAVAQDLAHDHASAAVLQGGLDRRERAQFDNLFLPLDPGLPS